MADFLAQMADHSRARCVHLDAAALDTAARCAPTPKSIAPSPFGVIAEIKPTSPSEGELQKAASDPTGAASQALQYKGASAISVLTEPSRFGGSLALLQAISDANPAPTMRKDFLVDPVQLAEARIHGASGALLIVRILDDDTLRTMLDTAASLGLFTLVECFDENDCARAAKAIEDRANTPEILVGVNCRNLATLQIEPERFGPLASALPTDRRRVAESGVHTAADAKTVAQLGYQVALVGTALMRSNDPSTLLREMLDAGANANTQETTL